MTVIDKVKEVFGYINEKGQEVPDPTPLHVSMGIEVNEPIEVRVARILRTGEFARAARDAGYETYDESNDFDVGGEDEVVTPYEAVVMAEDFPDETIGVTEPASEPVSEPVSDSDEGLPEK